MTGYPGRSPCTQRCYATRSRWAAGEHQLVWNRATPRVQLGGMNANQSETSGMGHTTGRVVVLGASMSGLLAARVLSDHAARVVVIERDELPEGETSRKGVPQGR